ncbi:MAG TPA: insulinase family protein [Sphingomonas sp.]|nr:insulinase family protein [Sphingomonas sp.]
MFAFPRALRLPFLLALLVAAPSALDAQTKTLAPRETAATSDIFQQPGWLYEGSDIKPDPDWYFGTLPNGLRYAVRRNSVPPGQVAIRVRIDAGSLAERETERGFAHFIEHLSFRGSKGVPDGEARRIWQRLGATFGSDTNAQTTPTQTVYQLDLPSATEASVGESLRLLAGMMEAPNLDKTALDSERPVVLAEQREQPGPQVKFSDLIRETFFAGQPLADRSPIGNIKTLEAATPESVQAFHDRWYRPTRTVVVLVGDIDPVLAGKLIAQHFGGWKGVGPDPADPDFGTPDKTQPAGGALAEPGLPPLVAMATIRPWHFNQDTVIFNQKRMIDMLAARIINRRLETRARAGGSYIQAQVDLEDVSRSVNATFVNIMPIGDDWEAAVRDVRAVIADAMANPPDQAEIDRAVSEFDAVMKSGVDTAAAEQGTDLADTMVGALDIRETTTSAATSYAILTGAEDKKMFTPASVLASTRKIFDGIQRAVVTTRTADPNAAAKLAAVMKEDVSGLAGKRKALAATAFSQLPPLGAPGKVVSRAAIAGLDMEQVVFANGARLMLFPNNAEANRVYVNVRFGRGYNALPADKQTPAWAADLALVSSGIGKLGQDDLDALTAGRRIGMDFSIDDDAFLLSAMTSPQDLADQLKLIADKLAAPGWDPNPVTRARAVMLAGYPSLGGSPAGVLARDLEGLLHDGDPRWDTPDPKTISALTPETFRALWEPLLRQGPIEVQVFGDIPADDAIKAVAATIGALKPRTTSTATAAPIGFPDHVASPVVRAHSGPENQAAAVIAWPTGGGLDRIGDSRALEVLAAVMSDRMIDQLRSQAGISYSPQVVSDWPKGLASGGRLIAVGQVPPDKTGFFFTLARKIAADLVAHPITDDELQRVVTPLTQYVLRASTGNQFWMQQLGGATTDPRRIAAARAIVGDLKAVTPATLQTIAARYLRPDKDWTMEVVPEKVAARLNGTGTAAAGQD